MSPKPRITIPKGQLKSFCEKHGIKRLSLFGSVLTERFGPESDVDVLVEFKPGRSPSFFKLFDMEEELSSILNGRKVDLRTPEDLSRYFREDVRRKAVVQYAA